VGLAVAAASLYYIHGAYARADAELVKLPVPRRDIGIYETVGTGDLAWKEFSEDSVMSWAARTAEEVVGKTAAAPLAKGMQINKRCLASDPKEVYGGRYVVAVNTDYARSAGAQPGDVVDVYWVTVEQAAWVPGSGNGAVLVAKDARVIGVKSRSVLMGKKEIEEVQGTGVVDIIELAVKPEEAPRLVGGALPQDVHVVLVKKPGSVTEAGGKEEEVKEREG